MLGPFDWKNDSFYTKALVLGIDIGIEGIGVWLRKGREPVYTRTFWFDTPEAAPLKGRRSLRGGRRCRQSEQHREAMLKEFCAKFDLPCTEVRDERNADGPFKVRLRAVRSKLASKEALVVCLRHIIKHRGYDYHETEGGSFPWGDELKPDAAIAWARAAYCSPADAGEILHDISDCGWKEKPMAAFQRALNAAVARYKEGIEAGLDKHFAQDKNNLREPARKKNFPRSLVWEHTENICRQQADYFGGQDRLPGALAELKKILDYHRKKPGALAERKVNRCPLASLLFNIHPPKCDPCGDERIRRFKLLEFLAKRTFVTEDGNRVHANEPLMKWLLDEVLAEDIRVLEANKVNGAPKQPRRKFDSFRADFIAKFDEAGKTKLASNTVSHNKDFFEHLTDLIRPKLTVLAKRASLCGQSADELFKRAAKNGFDAELIRRNMSEKQFGDLSYYEVRQAAAAGFGIYPQVEFLFGCRVRRGKHKDQQAVPGMLRQIFALPEVVECIGSDKKPDYAVIETVGDPPRNAEQARAIQEEQKARRKFKDDLFDKFGIADDKQDSEKRKRVLLYDQQGGSRDKAICPYTGKSLGGDPLSRDLEIDHTFPERRGGISEMVNLVLTHRKTNNERKKNQTPYEAFGGRDNTGEWRDLVARVQKMGWNKQKRDLVLRDESTCPEWDNMTRMAQLARQLREEAARWLGILGNDAKVRERIGTPTGYQTSVCRESWSDKLPADLYPKKNRYNMRHHLWDAAIISHIPPGKGLQHVRCGGIFERAGVDEHGNIAMRALPGLGPDLLGFEKAHEADCLVIKPMPRKTKKSRFQQTIYGHPDECGIMWARDPIDTLAGKQGQSPEKLKQLLRDAGIDENQLPDRRFDEWWERRQAQFFTYDEARSAVGALGLAKERQISDTDFDEWWNKGAKGDKKKLTDKSLRALLAQAHIPKDLVSNEQLQGALLNRGDPGPLTRKDGTEIRGVSGTASTMTPMAVIPHCNGKGETIGFKLATESFIRAEIWTTEKRHRNGEVIRAGDGKPELAYHRRLIPHARGLKNLSLRILKRTGKRLTWERPLTEEEIVELGLKDNPEVKRLRKDYDRARAQHEKATAKSKLAECELTLMQPGSAAAKPKPPVISLRKIYTGLPPHAKRLTNAHGADISRFEKGDLLLVPVNRAGAICELSAPVYRERWYRVMALKANGQIELKLAEFKEIKRLSEKELKEGKFLTPEQEWLSDAFLQQPGSDEVIGRLLQRTRADDQPPHSVK